MYRLNIVKLIAMNSLKRVVRTMYSSKYLLATNTISGGVLLAAGDGIQQGIEFTRGKNLTETYDWKRTGRLFTIGIIGGPFMHVYYKQLDKIWPGVSTKIVVKKVLTDQIIIAPFSALLFFMGLGLIEGQTASEAWKEFKEKFPIVYAVDWVTWGPAQAINFYYVPGEYRVLFITSLLLVYNVFLSFMKHKDKMSFEEQQKLNSSVAHYKDDLNK